MTERFWCTACGTVTRDMVCDCNRYGKTDCQPQFVNYADAMQEEARVAAGDIERLRAALEQIAIVCTDNMDRDCDHRMALDFVRQVANDGLDAGLPTAADVRGILATPPLTSKPLGGE